MIYNPWEINLFTRNTNRLTASLKLYSEGYQR